MTKTESASNSFGATVCFIVLAFGLCWMVQIPAALADHGLIHVHVPRKLQVTLATKQQPSSGLPMGRRESCSVHHLSMRVVNNNGNTTAGRNYVGSYERMSVG